MAKEKFPNHRFESQAMQCDKAGKHHENCWTGCHSMAALMQPDFTKVCPRGIVDEFGRKFHVGV